MKSDSQSQIEGYSEKLPKSQAAICRVLHQAIEAGLPKAASKIWHSMPVWFIGANPVVGYKATSSSVNLLFWSGQSFGEPGLKPVGKFKAAQIQFTESSQIDAKALRRWLKKSRANIWDYDGHFKAHEAMQKGNKK